MVDISQSLAANANILTKLASFQKESEQAIADLRKEREAAAKNVNLKEPSGPVEEFQKSNAKSSSNLQFFATDIGMLVQNTSRLNVIGTLAKNDTLDFYKFRVAGKGDAYLGQVGDEGVRVELIGRNGSVIADSNKDAGEKFEAFEKLQKGTLELSTGEYHLRVSRDVGVDKKESRNFAIQLRMGDYKQDYDTVVRQPKPGDDPFRPSASVQELSNMLNQQAAFLNGLKFGQSASDKLLGVMFNRLF